MRFKPAFSLYSFNFIKRLFISSLLSAIRVVSSAYVKFLIFLLAILIPACASSSLAFCMMYSAYKLNKQGDKPWSTPFPFLKMILWNLYTLFISFIYIIYITFYILWNLYTLFISFISLFISFIIIFFKEQTT